MPAENNDVLLVTTTLLGDMQVGKTALRTHLVGKEAFSEAYAATIGVDFGVKLTDLPNDKGTVKLQLWDISGDPRFSTITSTYLNGIHAILLCFDITSRDSFDNLETHLAKARNNSSDAPIFVVGLKADLGETRKVSVEEAEQFSKYNNCVSYTEASAKTGANVEKLFQTVAGTVYDKHVANAASYKKADELNQFGLHAKSEKNNHPSAISRILNGGANLCYVASAALFVAAAVTWFTPGMQHLTPFLAAAGLAALTVGFAADIMSYCAAGTTVTSSNTQEDDVISKSLGY